MDSAADVLILAGGFGTRMSDQFPGVPKPMIPVLGVPILERQVEQCRKYGLTSLCLLLHYEAQKIQSYFGDGGRFGVSITYVVEKTPLGTAGALLSALEHLKSSFLVLYADVYSDVDLSHLIFTHATSGADVTVVAHPNSHPHDSDILVLDDASRVTAISAHPHKSGINIRNMVNAAMYVFNRSALSTLVFREDVKHDIAQHLLPQMLENSSVLIAYKTLEYLKDMGTPERLQRVERDITNGVPKSRRRNQKRRAIFFDRDGTLNVDVGHLSSVQDFEPYLVRGRLYHK